MYFSYLSLINCRERETMTMTAKVAQSGSKWPKMAQSGPKRPRVAQSGQNSQSGPKWHKVAQSDPKWPRPSERTWMAQSGPKFRPPVIALKILKVHFLVVEFHENMVVMIITIYHQDVQICFTNTMCKYHVSCTFSCVLCQLMIVLRNL